MEGLLGYKKLFVWQFADKYAKEIYKIALGSLVETEYLLEFSKEQKYLNEKEYQNLELLRKQTGSLLWKLLKSQN